MNKYKEAKAWIGKINAHIDWTRCDIEEPTLSQLTELVELATQKKPIVMYDNFGDGTLCCPNCKKPINNVWSRADYNPNYCHYCGQRIDWSEEDE